MRIAHGAEGYVYRRRTETPRSPRLLYTSDLVQTVSAHDVRWRHPAVQTTQKPIHAKATRFSRSEMYSSSKVFEDIADLRFLLLLFCFLKVEDELVTVRFPD